MEQNVLTVDGLGQFDVITRELEGPGQGEVLVQNKATLISPGTELGGVMSTRENPDPDAPPRPFGYSSAGVVMECGEGTEQFREGDRVACGGKGASHADYICMPQNLVAKLPSGVSFEEATFTQLGATALNAVRRAEPEFGQYVAVSGLGVVGQLCCQLAALCGCHVMGIDRLTGRLAMAEKCGAEKTINFQQQDPVGAAREFSRGYGFDCGIIAFGGQATEACKTLYQMMKQAPDGHRYGNITVVGAAEVTVRGGSGFGNVDLRGAARTGPGYHDEKWHHGEHYPKVLVEWSTRRNHEEILLFTQQGKLNLKGLITDTLPLPKAPEGCEKLLQRPNETVGVVLKP